MSQRVQHSWSALPAGVARQADWAWSVAIWLALSSAGAGAYLVSQSSRVLGPAWSSAGRAGAAIGIALVMLGALSILFDLGRRARFYRAASRPGVSWESRAFLLLAVFGVLGCVQAAGWALGWTWVDALSLLAVPVALVLLWYGALLLRGMRAYPLWREPLQLALYPAGGLLAGFGVLALDPFAALSALQHRPLAAAIALLVVVNLLLLAAVVTRTRATGTAGAASADALVAGGRASLFWGGAIGVGLALPALLAAAAWIGWNAAPCLRVAAGSALLGLVCLRQCLLGSAHRASALTFGGAGPWGTGR